jgi:hypothetical protein
MSYSDNLQQILDEVLASVKVDFDSKVKSETNDTEKNAINSNVSEAEDKVNYDVSSLIVEGNYDSVIDELKLEQGKYIVRYSLFPSNSYVGIHMGFKEINHGEITANIGGFSSNVTKGKLHQGKQEIDLMNGKYIVNVKVTEASYWKIEIIRSQDECLLFKRSWLRK